MEFLTGLGLAMPVIAAPMAGGPGTPALVAAAGRAGSIGFLAAGYKTPQAMAAEIAAVRSSGLPFGVNVFAPNPVPVNLAAYRRYARAIQVEADSYGLDLTAAGPAEDDDQWHEKIGLLLAEPVAVASFTFGIPEAAVIAALHQAGTLVVLTVTSAAEARAAAEAGADALAVQSSAAGGHSATFTPQHPPPGVPIAELIAQVRGAVTLPLIAAGGLATSADIAAVLKAGAVAGMVGTVLLRTDESGASAVHKAALADPARGSTIVTSAFTGRPARARPNDFIRRYGGIAPAGYPALHHLTSPLRRAAAAAGDPERINLWAGTGHRHAAAGPAAQVLTRLAGGL